MYMYMNINNVYVYLIYMYQQVYIKIIYISNNFLIILMRPVIRKLNECIYILIVIATRDRDSVCRSYLKQKKSNNNLIIYVCIIQKYIYICIQVPCRPQDYDDIDDGICMFLKCTKSVQYCYRTLLLYNFVVVVEGEVFNDLCINL